MSQAIINKASALIYSKADYIGGGMDGYVVLSLIDEKTGYPVSSTITISKADGINWMSFLGDAKESNKAKRIANCNKACVCLASNEYNITLVGTIETITDLEGKKQHWQDTFTTHHGAPEDPNYCAWKFHTETYNIWFFEDGDNEARGTLKEPATPPAFEPILVYKNGQCADAINTYKKAFGAEVTEIITYADYNPDGLAFDESQKDCIMNAQVKIGNQTILVCDDVTNKTKFGDNLQMVMEFDTDDAVKAAYNALLDGATNLTPPHNAGYSSCVAGLTDAYGIPWQLMVWQGY